MCDALIVGLPVGMLKVFKAAATRRNYRVDEILAEVGDKGTLHLHPRPERCYQQLQEYVAKFDGPANDYSECFLLVLPYVQFIPQRIEDEILLLEDMGATVERPVPGESGWPAVPKRRPDQAFLTALLHKLSEYLFPELEEILPSAHLRELAEKNPRLLVAPGVLEICDRVAEIRYTFLKRAVDALTMFLNQNGSNERLDAFFGVYGLNHAQSGGVDTKVTVRRGHTQFLCQTANTHLKQGDKTTPTGAARVYYQTFRVEEKLYVVVLYAGPHPTTNVEYVVDLDELDVVQN